MLVQSDDPKGCPADEFEVKKNGCKVEELI